ncbi:MAG TPA: GNAT family N-acetyltransferase, partial [Gaiellaceae bacterium]|nr:GNAT family N-acetyltransferase [Gaiellaceae bacterium]
DGSTTPYPYFDAYWSELDRFPYLIDAEGEIVGFCLIRVADDGWHIAEFSILPHQRRKGIGRSAVQDLAERARAAGAAHLEARVLAGNRSALDFWLTLGFSVIEQPGAIVTRLKL